MNRVARCWKTAALTLTLLGGLVTCGGGGGKSATPTPTPAPPPPPALTSITVSPTAPSVPKLGTQQITATGHYSDGTTQDLTTTATWASSDTAIATVSNVSPTRGVVSTLNLGTVTITATSGTQSATSTLTVTAAALKSLSLSPSKPTLAVGAQVSMTVNGTYTDGSTKALISGITWTSSNTATATVNGSGVVTGVAAGSMTLTAASGTIQTTTTVTVSAATLSSILVEPFAPTAAIGTTFQMKATGFYSDGSFQDLTAQATWASATPALATVDAKGLVHALAAGTSTLSATLGTVSGSVPFTITAATLSSIVVEPFAPSAAIGTTLQVKATGFYSDGSHQDLTTQATWASSDATKASVDASGLVHALAAGSSTISAAFGPVNGSATITITSATLSSLSLDPNPVSLALGTSVQMSATGLYSDSSTADLSALAAWASSDATVASVNASGFVQSAKAGTTTLTATFGGKVATTTLTVTGATLTSLAITPATLNLPLGYAQAMTVRGIFSDGSTQDLTALATWTSSNIAVASISNAKADCGTVTARAAGTATLSASFGGKTATAALTVSNVTLSSITVAAASTTVPRYSALQMTATGHFSDGSTQDLTTVATWTSSDPAIATVSNVDPTFGLVSTLNPGTTTITAASGNQSGTSLITVTAATLTSLSLSPSNPTLPAGTQVPMTVNGTYSDGSTKILTSGITWVSGNTSTATVNSSGVVTGVAVGSTAITAASGTMQASTQVTVSAATLSSILVEPFTPAVAAGTTLQLKATGFYSDGSFQDLTGQATWASTAPAQATVDATGLVHALTAGTSTLSATLGSVSGSVPFTITSATLSSLIVEPFTPTAAAGTTFQMKATGFYSDGSHEDLTAQSLWTSTDVSKARVDASGLVHAVAAGSPTISATFGLVNGSTSFIVTPATLTSLSLDPDPVTLALGTSVQMNAAGLYSDFSTDDLSTQVAWTSSDPTVAWVSAGGLVQSVKVGTATLTASFGGKTATTTVTVTAATLSTLAISPAPPLSLPAGYAQALTVTGTFSDGSTQDLTSLATWTSSNTAVASISNALADCGTVTARAPGAATLSASFAGKSATAALTVSNATLSSITVVAASTTIPRYYTQQMTATGHYSDGSTQDLTSVATWTSSAPTIATVSNVDPTFGLVSTLSYGTVTISASYGGQTGNIALTVTTASLTSVTISPVNTTVKVGARVKYIATGHFDNGATSTMTNQVTWISSNTAVATITNTKRHGTATARSAGVTTITAVAKTSTGNLTANTTLTVN